LSSVCANADAAKNKKKMTDKIFLIFLLIVLAG
jgi:hypothetical protein